MNRCHPFPHFRIAPLSGTQEFRIVIDETNSINIKTTKTTIVFTGHQLGPRASVGFVILHSHAFPSPEPKNVVHEGLVLLEEEGGTIYLSQYSFHFAAGKLSNTLLCF